MNYERNVHRIHDDEYITIRLFRKGRKIGDILPECVNGTRLYYAQINDIRRETLENISDKKLAYCTETWTREEAYKKIQSYYSKEINFQKRKFFFFTMQRIDGAKNIRELIFSIMIENPKTSKNDLYLKFPYEHKQVLSKNRNNFIEFFNFFSKSTIFNESHNNQNNELYKIKEVLKDLLTNPNDLLIARSNIKRIGFSPKEFYNKFVHITNGEKPIIKWNGNAILDKSEYQKTLNRLENQRKVDNLFYLSKEWLKRSNDISARDKEKCIYCGKKCHTVHHKKSALYNPELCLDPNNLITVCKRCEGELHFRNRGDY